jgi:GNAT superfamily N-acetyltransferase
VGAGGEFDVGPSANTSDMMVSDALWLPSGWLAPMYRSFSSAIGRLAAGSEGARFLEPEGLVAAVSPAIPERSVFNSVLYEKPESLAAALGELTRTYEEAGVDAWTVWVPEQDRASAELLDSAGHKLDATPRAMVLDLADLADPDDGDLDWSAGGSLAELKRINDAAYGYAPGTFERGIGRPAPDAWRLYEARLDGRPASMLATTDLDGDCGIWWVATLPEARGRGLAGRLLHIALAEARERGMQMSTLQATKLGRPVYERLGYRDIGELQMWELRR